MEVTVSTDELLAEYREQLGEAHHQMMMMKIALEKANTRVRELESALGQQEPGVVLDAGPVERPRRLQVARQPTPGMNGAQKDGDES